MSREWQFYLADMLQSARQIRIYIGSMDKQQFLNDRKTYDAVIRNLEIIGEASKYVPQNIKDQLDALPWRNIYAMRNILAHAYFGIDDELLWDTVSNDIPALEHILSRKTDS